MRNEIKTPKEIKREAGIKKDDKSETKSIDYPMTDQNGSYMQHACDLKVTAKKKKRD